MSLGGGGFWHLSPFFFSAPGYICWLPSSRIWPLDNNIFVYQPWIHRHLGGYTYIYTTVRMQLNTPYHQFCRHVSSRNGLGFFARAAFAHVAISHYALSTHFPERTVFFQVDLVQSTSRQSSRGSISSYICCAFSPTGSSQCLYLYILMHTCVLAR